MKKLTNVIKTLAAGLVLVMGAASQANESNNIELTNILNSYKVNSYKINADEINAEIITQGEKAIENIKINLHNQNSNLNNILAEMKANLDPRFVSFEFAASETKDKTAKK